MSNILIVAGESSGEKYGAGIMRSMQALVPGVNFYGIGGENMREAGAELLYPVSDLSVVGVFEILSQLPRIKRIFRRLYQEAEIRRPDAAVLIDSPDFNLRLAKKLKNLSVPVLYYISPTVWAWRKGRLKTIKKYIDKMLLIFPFEETIYREYAVPAVFVGHPLLSKIQLNLSREKFFSQYGLDPRKKLIALLPGSRESEISFHMPALMNAASRLNTGYDSQLILLQSEALSGQILSSYSEIMPEELKILRGHHYDALAYSDLALSACGTANLEAALLGTPVVAFYRIHPLTYYLGRSFARIRHFSIVNILAKKQIVPELIQRRMTAANLVKESSIILNSPEVRSTMIAEFSRIKKTLGRKHSFDNAAREISNFLNHHSA